MNAYNILSYPLVVVLSLLPPLLGQAGQEENLREPRMGLFPFQLQLRVQQVQLPSSSLMALKLHLKLHLPLVWVQQCLKINIAASIEATR